jgi:nitrate/nitrite-specific signal transduction histidine kinase
VRTAKTTPDNDDVHARARHKERRIELTTRDEGVGLDPDTPHPGHHGLIGMREQAQLMDAELSLTSEAHRDRTLRMRLHIGPTCSPEARTAQRA